MLPKSRLNDGDGCFEEYRWRDYTVEFRANDGMWRVLEDQDIQFHFVLHTEVAKWLDRTAGNANRPALKSTSR